MTDHEQITDSTGDTRPETQRGRVRRLLLDPLGFRFKRGTDAATAQARLDQIADDVAYLTDDQLQVLEGMLRTKGQGADRAFWPEAATFRGFAEIIHPRSIEDVPALRRWFASVEGPKAQAEGTLVETAAYFEHYKVPTAKPGARKAIADRAAQNQRRLTIVAERRAAGLVNDPDDLAFERWYQGRAAYLDEMVSLLRAAKGGGQ